MRKTFIGASIAVGLACVVGSTAMASTASPTFTDQGLVTSPATSTRLYRADLTGLGLSKIGSLTITDSDSGVGGSPGIYSGFDLDAIFLDVDGDATTTGDQIYGNSFVFTPGSIRGGGSPISSSGGPTNGSTATNAVDEAWATLDTIDGIFFGPGSLTLGDGGSLSVGFVPDVVVGSSLFLFVGEVSGDPGETVTGLVEVSEDPLDTSVIPLPAGVWLMLSGIGALAWVRRRA